LFGYGEIGKELTANEFLVAVDDGIVCQELIEVRSCYFRH